MFKKIQWPYFFICTYTNRYSSSCTCCSSGHITTHFISEVSLLGFLMVLKISSVLGSTCHKALFLQEILQHTKITSDRRYYLQAITTQMTNFISPFNEGCPHGGCYSRRLGLIQLEDTLYHRQFCCCCVHATEGAPVIHHHACSNHLGAPINSAGLQHRVHILTMWVAAQTTHTYITHQLNPFTHQYHILQHMHFNSTKPSSAWSQKYYMNILSIWTTLNINFKWQSIYYANQMHSNIYI